MKKMNDIIVRLGDGRHGRPMLKTEIIAAGDERHYSDIIDMAFLALNGDDVYRIATVYQWNGEEYEIMEWLEVSGQ